MRKYWRCSLSVSFSAKASYQARSARAPAAMNEVCRVAILDYRLLKRLLFVVLAAPSSSVHLLPTVNLSCKGIIATFAVRNPKVSLRDKNY